LDAVVLGGGIHRLARQIGPKQVMEMVLTVHSVIAVEGFRMRFVNQVIETDALDTTVISGEYRRLFCFAYPACIKFDDRHMMSDRIVNTF
jgi:1,4-dihydroxy-2-naphthoyl-CoA synthase